MVIAELRCESAAAWLGSAPYFEPAAPLADLAVGSGYENEVGRLIVKSKELVSCGGFLPETRLYQVWQKFVR